MERTAVRSVGSAPSKIHGKKASRPAHADRLGRRLAERLEFLSGQGFIDDRKAVRLLRRKVGAQLRPEGVELVAQLDPQRRARLLGVGGKRILDSLAPRLQGRCRAPSSRGRQVGRRDP